MLLIRTKELVLSRSAKNRTVRHLRLIRAGDTPIASLARWSACVSCDLTYRYIVRRTS